LSFVLNSFWVESKTDVHVTNSYHSSPLLWCRFDEVIAVTRWRQHETLKLTDLSIATVSRWEGLLCGRRDWNRSRGQICLANSAGFFETLPLRIQHWWNIDIPRHFLACAIFLFIFRNLAFECHFV
jgi:hypothetical protein